MSDKSTQHYFLEIWLRSMEQPMVFSVAEAAWGRFKKTLQTRRKGYFIFATSDGRTLALNLNYVQLAHFHWEAELAGEGETPREESSELALYFLDRERESFEVDDPVDLAKIFTALKPSVEGEMLTFTDVDRKEIMFFTGDLILVEAATDYVEAGYTKVYFQERGTLPPR